MACPLCLQGQASIALSPALPLSLASASQATVPVARASMARSGLSVARLGAIPQGASAATALQPLLDGLTAHAAVVARTALDANALVLEGDVSRCMQCWDHVHSHVASQLLATTSQLLAITSQP